TEADTLAEAGGIVVQETDADSSNLFSRSFQTITRTLVGVIVLGLVINGPYKRFFKRKRKGRRISPKLREHCRKYLLRVPMANALLLALAFLLIHLVMLIRLYQLKETPVVEFERRLFLQFFYISLVASLLVVLFIYFWEKHRVHMRYIEHLYSPEELRARLAGKFYFRIRNRMWITSGMTTLLPLAIVIFYLFLSLTTLSELRIEDISDQQAHILFGKYLSLFEGLPRAEFSNDFFYVNAIDSILMFIGIFTGIFISLIYILFFVRWNTEDIVSPVKQLLASMESAGEGELEQYSLVRTNDEVGQLTEGYNQMTARLKAYFDNINGLTEAYSRFVPRQFLDILGKESYTDIRLGDQVEREMTILFSDMRSFTTLSETMSPKQNFDFINAYLGVMEPVIRQHNGFIDKYIGDAIMALFPRSPEDAVGASLAMRGALSRFNRENSAAGWPTVEIGIGIHTGRLMLGIVGAEGRMDGTVISDAVNLAARLEGLTKEYGCHTIISEESIGKMSDQ
ncbi:MAG TPA: adenylate/guanylate cyclase domain-containing protein, partial [Bacteroidales bacterium]|nr:adenylate/guanylate cyclase domain-containing protein [Bacteroidales bacterium]